MKRLRVGVIYGGRSSEHEVSLASAAAVLANLDPTRYEPIPILIDKRGRWSIAERPPTAMSAAEVIQDETRASPEAGAAARETHLVADPTDETLVTIQPSGVSAGTDGRRALVDRLSLDVVFPVVHGPYGEDGTLQGLLELANVAYVGAGVLSSAVGMDKAVAKVLFAAQRLPLVDYAVVAGPEWDTERAVSLGRLTTQLAFPVFVKPANLGSSVGVSKAGNESELEQAIDLARCYDRKIIVEAAVPNARELECAVLGNDTPVASVPGEIIPSREFYDYESKYLDKGSELIIPAPLSAAQTDQLRAMAIEAFRAIDAVGLARVDFLMAGDSDRVYLNELNTIPGFTTISMYAKLWDASGLSYPELLDRLIQLARERHSDKQQLRTKRS